MTKQTTQTIEKVENIIGAIRHDLQLLEHYLPKLKAEAEAVSSQNVARRVVIEQAKSFVKSKFIYDSRFGNHIQYESSAVFPEFHVNREKRTVTCLLKNAISGNIKSKGIARTTISDVFNVHIGKAIALAKALKQDIPQEFYNAPQPKEPEVGDRVKCRGGIETLSRRLPHFDRRGHGLAFNTRESFGWLGDKQFTLVDDSKE